MYLNDFNGQLNNFDLITKLLGTLCFFLTQNKAEAGLLPASAQLFMCDGYSTGTSLMSMTMLSVEPLVSTYSVPALRAMG